MINFLTRDELEAYLCLVETTQRETQRETYTAVKTTPVETFGQTLLDTFLQTFEETPWETQRETPQPTPTPNPCFFGVALADSLGLELYLPVPVNTDSVALNLNIDSEYVATAIIRDVHISGFYTSGDYLTHTCERNNLDLDCCFSDTKGNSLIVNYTMKSSANLANMLEPANMMITKILTSAGELLIPEGS
jgi:hypothetical protein